MKTTRSLVGRGFELVASRPVTAGAAVAILIGWFVSGAILDRDLVQSRNSRLLLQVGGASEGSLTTHRWWTLLTSQVLHVHFLHMGFNLGAIVVLAAALEAQWRGTRLTAILFFGGLTGQTASVMAYPALVSSGASQALMALCGGTFVTCWCGQLSRRVGCIAGGVVVVQLVLDIAVSQSVKAGHWAGFLAGVVVAVCIAPVARARRSRAFDSNSTRFPPR